MPNPVKQERGFALHNLSRFPHIEFQFPCGVCRRRSLKPRFTYNRNVLILDVELSGSVVCPQFIFFSIGVRSKVEPQFAQVNFFPSCGRTYSYYPKYLPFLDSSGLSISVRDERRVLLEILFKVKKWRVLISVVAKPDDKSRGFPDLINTIFTQLDADLHAIDLLSPCRDL